MSASPSYSAWHARGLLFENCSCRLVCPGHMHFDQLCTHERCIGYWAIRIDEGAYGDVGLDGARIVVGYDTPQHMIDGGWTETLIIDETASPEQRAALETILTGRAGGPWSVLARFVGTWLPTRYAPIEIEDGERRKRVRVPGVLEAEVEAIRGRDAGRPVTFDNIYNQIHAPHQVIATGSTSYDDGTIRVDTHRSHSTWSRFDWRVSPPGG